MKEIEPVKKEISGKKKRKKYKGEPEEVEKGEN